jgi:hypothetical protein
MLAPGEVIARPYRHPSQVHRTVMAGAIGEQTAAAAVLTRACRPSAPGRAQRRPTQSGVQTHSDNIITPVHAVPYSGPLSRRTRKPPGPQLKGALGAALKNGSNTVKVLRASHCLPAH